MTFDTLLKLRKLYAILVAVVVAVLLVVAGFVIHTVHQSQLRYYTNAEETSRNLAISLENFLHSHFQEVDLAMRRAALEFRSAHEQHRFQDAAFSAYLSSLRERIPNAVAVRGSGSDGMTIYGDGVDLAHPQDLKIREFFQRARTERDLIFGVPVKSRISGQWVLPLMYAMTLPDNSFGGTAYVNINIARIAQLFASLNTGPHGVITLLDDHRRVLYRYPENSAVQIGSAVTLSAGTEAVLAQSKRSATYESVSTHDGMERVLSVERIGDYPVYVLVGLSSEDFLLPWRAEARNAALFLSMLAALSAALLVGVWFALRKQYQSLEQLMAKDQALQGSLAALTQSELRWRSLTEGLPQMVWTANAEQHVDFLSHHWHDYTGIPPERLLASGEWYALVHPDDKAALNAAWRQARANGTQFRCDCRLRRHDGVWRLFDHHALAQKNADGSIAAWVGSSTDITEAREAHDALLAAKDQALQAGRAKSDFVANMSHEIRTPMNAVLGMLQLLQQTRLEARQHDYASKAEAAARALLGLLNDILDFSKVEAGKLTLDLHPFSFDQLLRDLAVILSANVGDKDVEVLFDIDQELPDRIVGDALRLQQVLLNLLGNAVKFTARGEVVLSVRLQQREGDRLAIACSIRDTGIGISPEQCERIFDGFSQAEASTARRYGGTGLGLAISQRLVRLMGGTLRVDSVAGQGSVFDFVIECQAAPQQQVPEEVVSDRLMQSLDCLVVDDNPVARQVLSEMAMSFGWRVDAVASGFEALTLAAQGGAERPYDVVFIDWRMPHLDGWETSRRLRQLLPAAVTPLIVMVTAHDRELLAQKQAQLEPVLDGVLVKPVTASMLFDAVADARLGRRRLVAQPSPSSQQLTGLRLLLVEDNLANQQVARELLSHHGAQIEVAGGGQAAIEAACAAGARFDLILMDIQMPDMDGYAATRAIRARLGQRVAPIVAMTANVMEADRVAAREAGMVDHVGKPFDLAQLIGVILRHTGRSEDAQMVPDAMPVPSSAPAAPSATAPVQAALPPEMNGQAALARMGGHVPIYLLALQTFAAEVGKIASQLRAAMADASRSTAAPLLHTLKGLAGTVGAERLAGVALRAEQAVKDDSQADSCWEQVVDLLEACPLALDAVQLHVAQLTAKSSAAKALE